MIRAGIDQGEDKTLISFGNCGETIHATVSSVSMDDEISIARLAGLVPVANYRSLGFISVIPPTLLNHHSPVSVLDNVSSTNSNSNDNGSTIAKVPTNFPVRARSTNRRRRGRVNFGGSLSQQILGLNQVNVENKRGSAKRSRGARSGKRCLHCQTDKTPQWREGPMGPRTLCNACGVRFRSGRLVPEYRPVKSPTFSSELHSNFHRKVVEMRKKEMAKGGTEQ
ncbi:hypothetical protein DH2020_048903 [Rehmannia glutinosa]|uniref:GATA-type domain-containing protein n=1 Tax=Rehmannia glutinosa TaxID=99300 RepID=A0ABR0U5I5_REHGL